MSAGIILIFEALMRMVVVNSFKQALHLTAEDHDVSGIGEVGHKDVGSNLNSLVIL